ncbi:MAG: hypothetical protein P4L53_26520 [Candidatus Obscuribacterales bacterium]|nr:hypothetical protein [Candidatus Obscuribacterales bacterium]
MAPIMLIPLSAFFVSNCTTNLDVAIVHTIVPQCVFTRTADVLIAESQEDGERHEEEIRERQSDADARRARELTDQAAAAEKEWRDEKMPTKEARDFL